jgi:hypothetical protein
MTAAKTRNAPVRFIETSMRLLLIERASFTDRNDHTTMTAPHPVRSAKLSIVWPGKYYGGGPRWNPWCCSFAKSYIVINLPMPLRFLICTARERRVVLHGNDGSLEKFWKTTERCYKDASVMRGLPPQSRSYSSSTVKTTT